MTATCDDQHQLKSTLAQTEPSTHDSTTLGIEGRFSAALQT